MEELLGELPLHYYRSLGNPTRHVPMLLEDFSRARDQLPTPVAYLALVEAMPPVPAASEEARDATMLSESTTPATTFTPEQIARARERALAYGVWDRALCKRGLVDFGGLIQRAVGLLRARPSVQPPPYTPSECLYLSLCERLLRFPKQAFADYCAGPGSSHMRCLDAHSASLNDACGPPVPGAGYAGEWCGAEWLVSPSQRAGGWGASRASDYRNPRASRES
jgi:hypothetical protein